MPQWGSSVALLAVFSSYAPLEIWASNVVGVGHWERLLALIVLAFGVGLVLWSGLVWAGVRGTTALFCTTAALVLAASGGALLVAMGDLGGALFMVSALTIAVTLVARIPNHRPLRIGLAVAAIFLISGPLMSLVDSWTNFGTSNVVDVDVEMSSFDETPDIWLVVLDGYAGSTAYRQDGSIVEPPMVSEPLSELGFDVYRSAWAAYPTTTGSVPSLLEMGYVLDDGAAMNTATVRDLYHSIGGSNNLNAILTANGYTTTMIEAGWSGSGCGAVDRCVESPFLDEAVVKALERSVLAEWIAENYGYAFTNGAQSAMSWVLLNARELDENKRADFIFAHVMAPHPPFFLSEECEIEFDYRRSGVQFSRPSDSFADRVGFYEDQARCVNSFMLELARSLGPDTVVIFVGDHGTDSRNQLSLDAAQWELEAIQERMNTFLAIRAAPGCDIPDGLVIPEVPLKLVNCLADLPSASPPSRIFIESVGRGGQPASVVELDPELVRELIDSRLGESPST